MKNKSDKPTVKLEGEAAVRQIYQLMGLAKRAGFAQGGEFLAEKAVRSGRSCLLIVAGDASDNTKKKFSDMCSFHETPFYVFSDKDSLGHAIGTEFRASVTINNAGMARKIIELLNSNE